jgi:hypothetical protein
LRLAYRRQQGGTPSSDIVGEAKGEGDVVGVDEGDSVGGQLGSMIGDGVRRWDAELVILSVKLKVREM